MPRAKVQIVECKFVMIAINSNSTWLNSNDFDVNFKVIVKCNYFLLMLYCTVGVRGGEELRKMCCMTHAFTTFTQNKHHQKVEQEIILRHFAKENVSLYVFLWFYCSGLSQLMSYLKVASSSSDLITDAGSCMCGLSGEFSICSGRQLVNGEVSCMAV